MVPEAVGESYRFRKKDGIGRLWVLLVGAVGGENAADREHSGGVPVSKRIRARNLGLCPSSASGALGGSIGVPGGSSSAVGNGGRGRQWGQAVRVHGSGCWDDEHEALF
jgi:hypothetical protein